ncbi:hypothetical protein PtB15_14B29 [Puccinia triticina]|nr:hypothetical protein PtB15_14B29 [Puccinia triticina]
MARPLSSPRIPATPSRPPPRQSSRVTTPVRHANYVQPDKDTRRSLVLKDQPSSIPAIKIVNGHLHLPAPPSLAL